MATDAERIEHDARTQPNVRITICLDVGRLLRGSVRSVLLAGAFRHGVHMDIQEDRGWLESRFYITVTGAADRYETFRQAFNRWYAQVNE